MGFKSLLTTGRWSTKSASNNQTLSLQSHDPFLYRLLGNDGFKWGTQSRDFLLEAYGTNPYVFMVVDRICQRLIQIDKIVLDKNEAEVENPDFEKLLKQPNSKENGDALLYRAAATYLVAGECFLIRVQALGEDDQYFVPINYNVQINEDTQGNVINYWVTMFGESETYLPNEVLRITKPDITFDTNHGFSTLRALRKVWESNNEVWASEASLHKNKGISGVLYSDGSRPMTEGEREQIQQHYDQTHTGSANFGKVKVTTEKLGFVQMGMNPNDLKSIETRIEHLRTICAAYNVDSKLFGDPASSTYNNMAEAQVAMIINAVIPLSKILLPKIIGFMALSVFRRDYSMKLDENTIAELQLKKEQQSVRLGREVMQGLISPQQAREMLYPELVAEVEEDDGENNPPPTEPAQPMTAPSIAEIMQLQEAITNETMSREGAQAILIQLYGFDEQTANEILLG